MKLYYSPGACSLSDHIALTEAGIAFEAERVDLTHKTTASGGAYAVINPKGYVPALVLESGEVLTENVAILDWIASRIPSLGVAGPLGRTRLLEALAYISSEVHQNFEAFHKNGSEKDKQEASAVLTRRLQFLADQVRGGYLFGRHPSAADCYLFVMLLWAGRFGIALPKQLVALRKRMLARPTVQAVMAAEGLGTPDLSNTLRGARQAGAA